ncbi:MAG TPA: terminase family protein [Ktedonobacterales bacterium]|nr:terminase family protein [Ktedonobacterales bacterium]
MATSSAPSSPAHSLALDLARALDPARLAEAAGIAPDPWQARVLRSVAPRLLLNCSRQVGKSTVTSILALHTALYEPAQTVLLLSPSQRQSGELFKKCLATYRALGRPVPSNAENALSLELDNDSRIVSLPGKEGTIRGFSGVNLIVIDEASRVADDLYRSVRPMLAVSGGRLAALSTPWGTRGFFYEAWRSDEPWDRYEVRATDCPRISAAFLAEERRNMGDFWYRQEYECQFEDAQTQAFRREDIERAFAQAETVGTHVAGDEGGIEWNLW